MTAVLGMRLLVNWSDIMYPKLSAAHRHMHLVDCCFIRCPGLFKCTQPWNCSSLDFRCWLHWTRDSLGQLQPLHPLLLPG